MAKWIFTAQDNGGKHQIQRGFIRGYNMETYVLSEKQMDDWKEICREFAKRENANLVFVNETSFGIEKNGNFQHIYIDELEAFFKGVHDDTLHA